MPPTRKIPSPCRRYCNRFINSNPATDWIEQLHLTCVLQEPLIQLSNGENKRLQLAKALFLDPALLIMDNPFIGLDAEGRQRLHRILNIWPLCQWRYFHHFDNATTRNCPIALRSRCAVLENGQPISASKKSAAHLQPVVVAPALPADLIQQLKAAGEEQSFYHCGENGECDH